ncbi:MAG: hypothetical protein ABI629_20925 [bacterium]
MTATPTPAGPAIGAGVGVGDSRIFGSGAPRPTPNSCIEICLAATPAMPSVPPCSGADLLLGSGGTNSSGQFVDSGGAPGIPLSAPLANGQCVYAFDTCADERSAIACARLPAPAPALSTFGLGLAGALLSLLGWFGIGRLRRAPHP